MPIRLNLLAEAQAAEEARRRDPVKRAIWIAAMLVAAMLIWSSSLYFKAAIAKSNLGNVEKDISSLTNDYRAVTDNQKKLADINHRLTQLNVLTTNRFLTGTLMNALQKSTSLEDIQLTHLKLNHEYVYVEETKPTTNGSRVVPGKPATSTEKISLTLDGNDSSSSPGDLVAKYKDVLATSPYFKDTFKKPTEITLKNFSAPQISPDTGKSCVLFTLECRFPENTR